jgi:nitroreductase
MDLFTTIKERFSYRGKFKNQAIPREDLEKIAAAGVAAPSGCNRQTTEFVIIDDPQMVKKIGQMSTMAAVQTAQAMVLCIIDVNPADSPHYVVEDCAAATQNMLLAITGLGYASVWIDGWLRGQDRARTIGDMIGLPRTKIVRVLLPVGVPAEDYPRREKLPYEKRVSFNRYRS